MNWVPPISVMMGLVVSTTLTVRSTWVAALPLESLTSNVTS